ncbi:MAG: hypothetical protein M0Q92_10890 [Methanoregula sp.]|jgi:hypothetical protein|nr:hypothetical protein [Methanoregula sp.]
MTDNSGSMSVDFMVGFTFFILAFIWVATMVPGLFIGIQSHSIDFDAVAYRAGVILTEDPGQAHKDVSPQPWEIQTDTRNIIRFGLAVSKDTPRILDENKVNRFFNTTDFTFEDYHKRVIFGDYPYRFNISLREAGEDTIRSVGDIIPEYYPYGYIRRDVKIKHPSNTTIGEEIIKEFGYNNTEKITRHPFTIVLNTSHLRSDPVGQIIDKNGAAAYRIYPAKEKIIINITDFDEARDPANLNPCAMYITDIKFFTRDVGTTSTLEPYHVDATSMDNFLYVDGESSPVTFPQAGNGKQFQKTLSMVFDPPFFLGTGSESLERSIFINMTFTITPDQQFLNNSLTRPFNYNYHPANVTQPALTDAVLEVAIW